MDGTSLRHDKLKVRDCEEVSDDDDDDLSMYRFSASLFDLID